VLIYADVLLLDGCLQLWGLRRFRIPLRTNFQQPTRASVSLEQENTIR
jgi:hypothetical protein